MKVLGVNLEESTIQYLKIKGLDIESETDIQTGEELALYLDENFCGAIVDIEASGLGIYFARLVRDAKNSKPLIGLTSCQEDESWQETCAVFMENGGDYLIQKPANPRTIVASIGAAVRRASNALHHVVVCTRGETVLRINTTSGHISLNGRTVDLTGKERKWIMALASSPDRTISKEQILSHLYSFESDEAHVKIIDVFACKVRKKIAKIDPAARSFVQTVWGRGYTLVTFPEMALAKEAV